MANTRINPDRPLTPQERWMRTPDRRRANGHCTRCDLSTDRPGKWLCTSCNTKANLEGKKYRAAIKQETFKAYGGVICSCCKITEIEFLTLDHMEGNSWRNYKWRAGDKLYLELRRANYPPGFQVLCFNCNIARYNNGGICPHAKSL